MGSVCFLFTITGSVDGSHVLVLGNPVPDAAEGGLSILVDGVPHVGDGWLTPHDNHDTLPVSQGLLSHSLAVDQPTVAEGVVGLQVIGIHAADQPVPLIRKLEQSHMTTDCGHANTAVASLAEIARDRKTTISFFFKKAFI